MFFFCFVLVTPHGLWDLVPQAGIESVAPVVEAWSPNHGTAREFPIPCFYVSIFN